MVPPKKTKPKMSLDETVRAILRGDIEAGHKTRSKALRRFDVLKSLVTGLESERKAVLEALRKLQAAEIHHGDLVKRKPQEWRGRAGGVIHGRCQMIELVISAIANSSAAIVILDNERSIINSYVHIEEEALGIQSPLEKDPAPALHKPKRRNNP